MPNDMYRERTLRVGSQKPWELPPTREGQAGKCSVSSRLGLGMHTEVVNKTTTKKKRSRSIWIFPVLIYIISSIFPVEMFIKIAAPVIMQLPNSNQWGS